MKPTQAQIEAIADAIGELISSSIADPTGETYLQRDSRKSLIAALTAAAQVGEPEYEYIDGRPVAIVTGPGKWDDRFSGSAKEIEAHTIERCAQVAEQNISEAVSGCSCSYNIAVAIRKLKDAP